MVPLHLHLSWTTGGSTVYHDGTVVGPKAITYGRKTAPGTGRTLIGNMVLEANSYYTSVAVDEVKFWNRRISEDEVANEFP